MAEINYSPVERKLEELIRLEIKREGLVKSGKLYESIKVIYKGSGSFEVEAEDYFKYLDERYGIVDSVVNSTEFGDFLENFITINLEKKLDDVN